MYLIAALIIIAMIVVIAQGYARDKRRQHARKAGLPCAGHGDCDSCTNWEDCAEL